MAGRSLKIKYATSHYVFGRHDGVRIRVDITCGTNIDTSVFAYRMLPADPYGNNEGHFSHICSPVDMADWPKGGPNVGNSPEWFRLPYVDLLVRSVAEAQNLLEIIKCDLKRLLDTLCTMDTLMPGENELFTCGGGVDCQAVESSSVSQSSSSSSSQSLATICVSAVGTSELFTGVGVLWTRDTAGEFLISSSSSVSSSTEQVCVELLAGQASQLLLVNGFDFSSLPDNGVVVGLTSRVTLKDATEPGPVISSSQSLNLPSCASLPVSHPSCPRLSFLSFQHPNYGLGQNKADSSCIPGPDWETLEHGGSTDMWGFPNFSTVHLKDGSFGVGLVVKADFYTSHAKVCVSQIEIEVCYQV